MEDILLQCLRNHPRIDEFSVQFRTTDSAEWFYIRHKLDQSRRKSVKYGNVKVFVDHDGKRGNGEFTAYPSHTKEDLEKLIEEAVLAAQLIANPPYKLPEKAEAELTTESANLVGLGKKIIDFTFEMEAKYKGEINSFEVFTNNHQIRFVNSNGTDLTYSVNDAFVELIVNANDGEKEIELMREWRFATFDPKQLEIRFEEVFREARDRADAKPTPDLKKTDLILSGENVSELFGVYRNATHAASLFNKSSPFEPGQDVQAEAKGDKISFAMVDHLPASCANAPIDEDGVLLKPVQIFKDGVFATVWGDARHCQYLEVPITGNLKNMDVACGKHSIEEIEGGELLEVLDFSAFIVDVSSGDFGGEIRLGYLVKDGVKTPVSGGSVNGNLIELQDQLQLSSNRQELDRFSGPLKIRIANVTVSGIN
ncbi:MAG: metallopeptidase TldD-related protein [Erysipelotrichaceae bacterium]